MDRDKNLNWLASQMSDMKGEKIFISSEGILLDKEQSTVSDLLNQPYFTIKVGDTNGYNVICEKSFSYKNFKFIIQDSE